MRTKFYLLLIALVTAIGSVWGQAQQIAGTDVEWQVVGRTLTFSVNSAHGTGITASPDYVYATRETDIPWYGARNSVKNVVVGEGITNLGNLTLVNFGQNALVGAIDVEIPSSMTEISSDFVLDAAVNSFKVDESNSVYKSIDDIIFTISGRTLVLFPSSHWRNSYIIPSDVDTLAARSFRLSQLSFVDIPEGVEVIRNQAFYGSGILSFETPSTIKEIGSNVFDNCRRLEVLIIKGNGNATSGNFAFARNPELKTVYVEGISISDYAFSDCIKLTNVDFGPDVKSISRRAFQGCNALVSLIFPDIEMVGISAVNLISVTVPSSVITLEDYAFGNNPELTSITMLGSVPASIGSYIFHNTPNMETIYVPSAELASYQGAWNPGGGITFVGSDFTVDFNTKGGNGIVSQILTSTDLLEEPTAPEKDGYDFAGWFTDEACTVAFTGFGSTVTGNFVVYAKWLRNTYEIPLDANGGSVSIAKLPPVSYGNNIGQIPTPTRENHEFLGWFSPNGVKYESGAIFLILNPEGFVLKAEWTYIAPPPPAPTTYTVTITPLTGVTVSKSEGTVIAGRSFSFEATADARGNRVIVFVNGTELPETSDNFYLIEGIEEDKTVTFRLTAGTYTENSIVGGITINGEPLDDKKTDFPEEGKIVITFNGDADTDVPGKVIIDGKEVPGTWGTDSEGNPTYTIEYDVEGDGEHTIVIEGFGGEGETHKFVTGGGKAGNEDSIVGGITINGEPLDDKKTDFPTSGEIVITFNGDADTDVPGKVIIDGKEVPGTWGTDSEGNPTYTIEYDVEGDGEHTIVIEGFGGDGETHKFVTGGGNGNNDNTGGGKVVIDDTTPSDIPGDFPGGGEIIIYPPVVTYPETPEVIIDGEKVVPGGSWGEDENGDPVFIVEYDGLEDGPHTIEVNGKEYTFTVKNGGATSNDALSVAKITASYGTVTIDTPKQSTVYVVSLSGSVVYNANVVGTVTVNVPAGIYIVAIDGKTTKVVVR